MKKDIHPKFFPKATVTCACGNTFHVGSTQEKITVEICSACHPFYTGTEKVLDTAGRVEKFRAKRAAAKPKVAKKAIAKTPVKKEPKAKKEAPKEVKTEK